MIKPVGPRVLLNVVKNNKDQKIILADNVNDNKEKWRFYVLAIGDDCFKKIPLVADNGSSSTMISYCPFEVGDEVIVYSHAFFQQMPDFDKNKSEWQMIVPVSDIWGVIKKEKE